MNLEDIADGFLLITDKAQGADPIPLLDAGLNITSELL